MLKRILSVLLLLFCQTLIAEAQLFSWLGSGKEKAKPELLLMDRGIQIETTAAINNMYNFNFYEAEKEFKWLMVKYPDHPIGSFLLGLNEWWKIVPDTKVSGFDDLCHKHMDDAISKAEKLYDSNNKNKEAAFFLAAAYSVKGRLYAEREKWVRAAWAGKQSLKYLDYSRGEENINPELLFGDGVYNYYSKWIQENYKSLRPLLTFFRKGNKPLGIKQLEYVANNAFYSRMEARYFLVQIYAMESQPVKGLSLARQMHALYPNNSFFHRYVARNSFALGRLDEAEVYARELLERVEGKKYGYGDNDGRYGAYILAYVNDHMRRNYGEAKFYYIQCINYAKNNHSEDSGYYLNSHMALGRIAELESDFEGAASFYKEVMDKADKKSETYKEAKKAASELKGKMKKKKK